MKKFLIIGLTVTTLSNTSFASDKTGFYFKANVGANKMSDTKEKNSISSEKIPINSNKSKSEVSPSFSIGTGYYFNDFIRTDVTFDYSKVAFKKNTVNFNKYIGSEDLTYVGQVIANRKSSIYSMILSGYADLPITDSIKFFVGSGFGLARIKEKFSQTWIINGFEENTFIGSDISNHSSKSKNKTNFAYSLTAGTSIQAVPNVNLELSYNYKNFGKAGHKTDSSGTATTNRYAGHILSAGIRFNI
jgi:opacity protein-like surface antigen